MRVDPESERGKFYKFKVPPECGAVTVDVFGTPKVINTEFTDEELEHIQRAREATLDPDFLRSAAATSYVRSLTTYCAPPWGGELTDRRHALKAIQYTFEEAEALLGLRYDPNDRISALLSQVRDSLLRFIPKRK